MNKLMLLYGFVLWTCQAQSTVDDKEDGVTRIIAIGDSITSGACSSDPNTHAWPPQLMNMLYDTSKYEVLNLGVSGRTMMKQGDYPYWNEPQYKQALSSKADFAFLMLGTNDAKNYQWNETAFRSDYLEMAMNIKNMVSKPKLYLLIPPPLYEDGAYSMNQKVINERFPVLIPDIAKDLGVAEENVIDLFTAMGGANLDAWQLFCDGQNCDPCHPNDAGYTVFASEVYKRAFMQPRVTADVHKDLEPVFF